LEVLRLPVPMARIGSNSPANARSPPASPLALCRRRGLLRPTGRPVPRRPAEDGLGEHGNRRGPAYYTAAAAPIDTIPHKAMTISTHDRTLRRLRLTGMASRSRNSKAFPTAIASASTSRLAMLVDREAVEREQRRRSPNACVVPACARPPALEDIDYRTPPPVSTPPDPPLATAVWPAWSTQTKKKMREKKKKRAHHRPDPGHYRHRQSFASCALVNQAARDGFSGYTATRLSRRTSPRPRRRQATLLLAHSQDPLLIIDDWALARSPRTRSAN